MTPVANRTDKAHDVGYPSAADSRGSARVNHLRRPYYLGPFESPQSYVMFGLWKHLLAETGSPPETKDLRPMVEQLLSQKPIVRPAISNRWFVPAFVVSSICLSIAIIGGAIILSTTSPSAVDNQALTATEIEFVRGMRMNHQKLQEDLLVDRGARVANLTVQLLAEGPKNAVHHRRKKVD